LSATFWSFFDWVGLPLPANHSNVLTNKKQNQKKEPLKERIEELIRRKSEENEALKKLLDGLNQSGSDVEKDSKSINNG
jgi:hypothetical protein